MRIAAIDIGSNSVKLLVAEPGSSSLLVPIRRQKDVLRLGHETLQTGKLSSDAIARLLHSIEDFKASALAANADEIHAVATASVREASNALQVTREIFAKTGIRVEVLSGVEEARLIGLAATYGANAGKDALLNIDIGGGSTELSLFKRQKAKALHSVKIGAVRLTEHFLRSDPPTPKELTAMRQEIIAAFDRPIRELSGKSWEKATGTSGTILAIGAAMQSIAYPDEESAQLTVPSFTIARRDLAAFNEHLAALSVSERKKVPGISNQRAEIIIAGSMILYEAMRLLKINRIETCTWSLREGVILNRMQELAALPTRAKTIEPHMAGAEALGRHFGFEEDHGWHVAHLAEQLFDQLKSLHGVAPEYRTLLSAGALLHDLGYVISHESHHKHSLYLILHSDLTGFTDRERLIIGNIARYHRKAMPKPAHPQFAVLSEADQQLVWKLGAIVRLADALDRSHERRVKKVEATARKDAVTLLLRSQRSCEHELWAVESKKNMFEECFGKRVEVRKQ